MVRLRTLVILLIACAVLTAGTALAAASWYWRGGKYMLPARNMKEALEEILTEHRNDITANTTDIATNSAHVFVRWGNTTAPPGTTLIYSGLGFADGTGGVIVKAGDPGGLLGVGRIFTPMRTGDHELPGAIPSDVLLQGAVCFSPTPTMVIWGTDVAPTGWHVLYSGYAFSSGGSIFCVDGSNFDDSVPFQGSHHTAIRGVYVGGAPNKTDYPDLASVKAAVIARNTP